MRSVKELSLSFLRIVDSQDSETGGNDRRDISWATFIGTLRQTDS
jgi:hypothetical protein